MSVLEETLPGSYAGVPFLVDRSRIEGGRKKVVKEFPNSNKQLVQDMGGRPRSYSLEIIINSDPNGNNYKQRRDNFLRVLESGSSSVLVHPLYGSINNIVVKSFILNEDFTALGEARFSVEFAVNDTTGTPIVSTDTVSVINQATEEALAAVQEDISENYLVSRNFPSNFTAASQKLNSMVNKFSSSTSFFQVAADEINSFSNELGELSENVTRLVSQPQELAESVVSLFQTVNGLYSSVEATFGVMQKFFDFGDGDTEIIQDTVIKQERARNNSLLNNLVRGSALILNYSNATQIEYSTVNEVERIGSILEDQYQSIVIDSVRVTRTTPILSTTVTTQPKQNSLQSSTLDSITSLRVQVQKFLEERRLSASQIVSINTHQIPARVLAYQYYGDSSLGPDISKLNSNLNVSFLKGDVEVFTE